MVMEMVTWILQDMVGVAAWVLRVLVVGVAIWIVRSVVWGDMCGKCSPLRYYDRHLNLCER
jgi:hypothetical protein